MRLRLVHYRFAVTSSLAFTVSVPEQASAEQATQSAARILEAANASDNYLFVSGLSGAAEGDTIVYPSLDAPTIEDCDGGL